MKSFVYNGVGKPSEIREVPRPLPGEGEMIVKVEACGICGSDLHAAAHGFAPPGVIMGHEYTGHVVDLGPGVSDKWKEGDRVFGIGSKPCRSCDVCARGDYMNCPNLIIQGYHPELPGGYAEYARCQADLSLRIPPEVSLFDAAACEPISVGLAGWRAAKVVPGSSVLVVGAGAIGLTVVKWARFFGAVDVAVSEIVPARMERAKQVGATVVFDASKNDNPVKSVQEEIGRIPMYIFECTGKPILQKLINMAVPKSHLVILGGSMEIEEISSVSAVLKNLNVTFSFGYEVPEDLQFSLQMMAEGQISVDSLITGRVGLEGLPEMFERLQKANEHCKVLLTP